MTFSLVGRCGRTGMVGAIVSSSSPAVAARCVHVRAGVGAAGTQNITDPRLGPALLDALAAGDSAGEAMARVTAGNALIGFRQLTVVDREGRSAVFSGDRVLGGTHTAAASDVAAAGNLLATPDVIDAMVASFRERPDQHLGDRLIAALQAGMAEGGEAGPVNSAGLLIAGEVAWPIADLRVDWSESDNPVGELTKLWRLWRPQIDDYVNRALDPERAPSYGVPGDL